MDKIIQRCWLERANQRGMAGRIEKLEKEIKTFGYTDKRANEIADFKKWIEASKKRVEMMENEKI